MLNIKEALFPWYADVISLQQQLAATTAKKDKLLRSIRIFFSLSEDINKEINNKVLPSSMELVSLESNETRTSSAESRTGHKASCYSDCVPG